MKIVSKCVLTESARQRIFIHCVRHWKSILLDQVQGNHERRNQHGSAINQVVAHSYVMAKTHLRTCITGCCYSGSETLIVQRRSCLNEQLQNSYFIPRCFSVKD